jgi:WD40 repeat protein
LLLPAGQFTPQPLADLIARMVEMDEHQRPASVTEIQAGLQTIVTRLADGSLAPPSTPAVPVQSRPAVAPTVIPSGSPPGKLHCQFTGTHGLLRTLAWSPDSLHLASSGMGSTLIDVWEADYGKIQQSYRHHQGNVRMVRWSPDGHLVASASDDRTVHVWDAHAGKTVQIYRGHTHLVTSLAWSPDGRQLVSSGMDQRVLIWDLLTGKTMLTYTRHRDAVYRVSWSPDGTSIATGGYDGKVRVWHALSGRDSCIYDGHTACILALEWSPDGQMLASGGDDTTVQVWSPFDGSPITTYSSNSRQIHSLSWSPDSKRIISGGTGAVPIWDALTGHDLFTYRGYENSPRLRPVDAMLQPLSGQVVPVEGQLYQYVGNHQLEINQVSWSPDGRWIASGGPNDVIHIWSAL